MSELARLRMVALLLAAVVVGCRGPTGSRPSLEPPKPAPPASTPAPTASSPLALPDVMGFAAGATSRTAGYVRRTYTRGSARLDVTLAHMPMSADDYASWVKMSTASFPQAALDLSPADANGFYQCSDGSPPSCDLLIQLRAGLHLEVRGNGTSSRGDVDALAHGLPLAALAGRPAVQ
jgi:hypothetical protein